MRVTLTAQCRDNAVDHEDECAKDHEIRTFTLEAICTGDRPDEVGQAADEVPSCLLYQMQDAAEYVLLQATGISMEDEVAERVYDAAVECAAMMDGLQFGDENSRSFTF